MDKTKILSMQTREEKISKADFIQVSQANNFLLINYDASPLRSADLAGK